MVLSLRATLTLWLGACFPRALELHPVYVPLIPLLLTSLCALFRTSSRLWPLCSMHTHDPTPLFPSTTMSVLLKPIAS
ncbi:hypothetical protein B0H13DRAFT_1962238, partial [Mycena leptocephala]